MRNALWVALVVVILAVIAWWMWVYRAPPAVPAEHQQSANDTGEPVWPVHS